MPSKNNDSCTDCNNGTDLKSQNSKSGFLRIESGAHGLFRKYLKLGFLLIFILWLLSGFYIVNQDETAVVQRFGKVTDPYVTPGIRWHLPWPFEKISKIRTTEIKRMSIGYKIIDDIQGIPPDPMEIQRLTADTNIVQIKIMVQYQIAEPAKFLFNVKEPHWLIRKFGEAALTKTTSSITVDEVLTTGKLQIQTAVRLEIQEKLEALGAGIAIKSCNLQEAVPPGEVVDAFNDVSRAKSDKERIKSEADSYRNEIVPKARGRAEEILNTAYSYESEIVNSAKGEVSSFLDVLFEYRKAPAVTRKRLFLEMIEQILPRAKMVVLEDKPASRGKAVIIK